MADPSKLGQMLGVPVSLDAGPLVNRPSTILGVSIPFMLISWLCVSLRLYTRFVVVKSPGWDDFFVILYLLTTTSGSVALMVSTRFGLGAHILELTPAVASSYLSCFYVMNASYTTSTACIKLSLLLQYLRVFGRQTKLWKVCVGLTAFTLAWGIAYSFLAWFPCFPVSMIWAVPKPADAHCYAFGSDLVAPFAGTFESHAATNMLLDLLVLAIPIPLYFEKGTPRRMRLSLLGLFLLGSIVNFLSIWRLITVIEHQAATYPDKDPTWYAPISLLLAALELDVASMCASLPIFWPVLEACFGRIFVTQEVEVTREARWGPDDLEDGAELSGMGTHSRAGSESELNKTGSPRPEVNLYEEAYKMGTWNPITGAGNAKATVRSEGRPDRRKWWRLM